jgi:hypothetical protein
MRGRPIAVRFFEKVNKHSGHFWHGSECWDWTASLSSSGYGQIVLEGHVCPAHVVSFYIAHGRLPKPFGLHHCDRPICVNPIHIFEGDAKANYDDAVSKERMPWQAGRQWGGWAAGENHWSCRKPESVLKGSFNPRAKLTESDVRHIRRRNRKGETKAALAREYGVSEVAIFNLVTRRTWRHV